MSLTSLYPYLLFLGLTAFLVTMIRLDRRISRGPLNAGARVREKVTPLGQDGTPWELRNLDRQLRQSSERTQLINMVARLVKEAGLSGDRQLRLTSKATDDEIDAVIGQLEKHLALQPLVDGDRR